MNAPTKGLITEEIGNCPIHTMSPSLSLSLISFLPVKSGGIALGSSSSFLYLANNHPKVSSCLSQRSSRFSRPIVHLAPLGTCLPFPFVLSQGSVFLLMALQTLRRFLRSCLVSLHLGMSKRHHRWRAAIRRPRTTLLPCKMLVSCYL
jgi:hypothetical protein